MEVPSSCLSTRSTIISLKLVTDAACPGIIIHSLPSTGRAGRCWPHLHARHPGRGTRGQAGPWAVSAPPVGAWRRDTEGLPGLGWLSRRPAGKPLHGDVAGWLPLRWRRLYPPFSAWGSIPHRHKTHTHACSQKRHIWTRPGDDPHGPSVTDTCKHAYLYSTHRHAHAQACQAHLP